MTEAERNLEYLADFLARLEACPKVQSNLRELDQAKPMESGQRPPNSSPLPRSRT